MTRTSSTKMPNFSRLIATLAFCLSQSLMPTQAQPQVLSIPGAGPPTALLRVLADEFNRNHAPKRVEIPQTVGMAGALRDAAAGAPLARMPRRLTTEEQKQGLRQFIIARQALVFVTGSDVEVKTLTRQQLADAFSGRVRSWREIGGATVPIRVFYREETAESLRQIRSQLPEFENLTFTPEGKLIHVESAVSESMQRFGWSLSWMSLENAHAAKGLKVLSLDGVEPGVDTLRSGKYPLHLDAVLIFKAQPSGLAREFVDFVGSPAGRAVIEAQGSLPVDKAW